MHCRLRGGLLTVVALVGTLLAGCGVQPLTSAERANAAVQAMDTHFYQSGRWQGAGYWQNAQAFSVVLDALQRTHGATYQAMLGQVYAANSQHGRSGDFTSAYMDDEGWWAVDWTRAWDLTGNPQYLQTAKNVFANMAATWGGGCGGGVWWNATRTYKNAIPNELFLLLAVELHERTPGDTGPDSYLAWARREADWFEQSGMINGNGLVNDGLRGCRNNGGTTWTYNQGVILAGLAELSKDSGDRHYLRLAERIANAATSDLVDAHGILREPCELTGQTCNQDQEQFKGIFVRYLWWLYTVDHTPAYRTFLQRQLQSLWSSRTTFGGLRPALVGCKSNRIGRIQSDLCFSAHRYRGGVVGGDGPHIDCLDAARTGQAGNARRRTGHTRRVASGGHRPCATRSS